MQLQRRVVVTGLGILSPSGNTVSEAWSACVAGRSSISIIEPTFPDSPISIGGRIKNLNPDLYLDPKDKRRLDLFVQYGVIAAEQAILDSNILDSNIDKQMVGVNFGSGIGGLASIETNHSALIGSSYKKVSPFFVPGSIVNMISGLVSIKHGFMGPNYSMVTACSTGNHCIGSAARSIAYGEADIMIAGGAEAASSPLGIAGFIASRALSSNSNPQEASRPWDKNRDGFVLSDGAGALVLEELEHAKERNAKIYAEVLGFGMSSDAYHMTAPPEDGRGAALAMKNALKDANISPSAIDYINAHGTSTPLGDIAETKAIKSVFTDSIPAISSTKSMIGHTLGAAGAIESIFSIMSIQDGIIPPTINLYNPDPECDLDYTPHSARDASIKIAMNNSFGFGGTNSSLVFSKI
ncbi:MAG: beta-ketoacyl-ACP synthase II [Gammaproteobacteria bacterium]